MTDKVVPVSEATLVPVGCPVRSRAIVLAEAGELLLDERCQRTALDERLAGAQEKMQEANTEALCAYLRVAAAVPDDHFGSYWSNVLTLSAPVYSAETLLAALTRNCGSLVPVAPVDRDSDDVSRMLVCAPRVLSTAVSLSFELERGACEPPDRWTVPRALLSQAAAADRGIAACEHSLHDLRVERGAHTRVWLRRHLHVLTMTSPSEVWARLDRALSEPDRLGVQTVDHLLVLLTKEAEARLGPHPPEGGPFDLAPVA